MLIQSNIAENRQGTGSQLSDREGDSMKAYERLLRYAAVHTSSAEESEGTPSTGRQRDLALLLAQEMTDMGLERVAVDDYAYVYGTLPASPGLENLPAIALIAHLDTVPDDDFPGCGVKPKIVPDYDGGPVHPRSGNVSGSLRLHRSHAHYDRRNHRPGCG